MIDVTEDCSKVHLNIYHSHSNYNTTNIEKELLSTDSVISSLVICL